MIADAIVIVVLLISAGISFMRGFIREVLTILGVVGGLVAAYFGGPILNPFMRGWFGIEEGVDPGRLFGIVPYTLVADALSYGAIFIVVVIVLSLFSHILAETARAIGLGAVDRSLGVVFGLVRGIVLLGLFYLPFHLLFSTQQKEQYFAGSHTIFYLEQTSQTIASILPDSAIEKMGDDVQKVKDGIETQDQIEKLKEQIAPQQTAPAAGESEEESAPGYDDEFRQRMDELFEQKTMPPQPQPQGESRGQR